MRERRPSKKSAQRSSSIVFGSVPLLSQFSIVEFAKSLMSLDPVEVSGLRPKRSYPLCVCANSITSCQEASGDGITALFKCAPRLRDRGRCVAPYQ